MRAEVPIYVEDAVIDEHGVRLNTEGELEGDERQSSAVTPEELEKLSAFQDIVSELDLDDLGKRGDD